MCERKKRISEEELLNHGATNSIYEAYKDEFEEVFAENRDRIPYGEKNLWYVSNRWNISRRSIDEPFTHEKTFHKEFFTQNPNDTIRVFLIYGGTGHGKSTFVQHYFRSYLPLTCPEISKSVWYIRINLLGLDHPEDIVGVINTKIKNRLYILLGSLFQSTEFQEYKGKKDIYIEQARDAELAYMLHFLCEIKEYKVILFYDNIDQESYDAQKRIFAATRNFAGSFRCKKNLTTIISVREYFLEFAKTEVPEKAYNTKPFRLNPPDIDALLLSRAEMLKDMSDGKKFIVKNQKDAGTTEITISEPFLFFLFIIKCFTSSKKLSLFLYHISGNNVRQQLSLLHNIIRSPRIERTTVMNYLHYFLSIHSKQFSWFLSAPLKRLKDEKLIVDPTDMVRYSLSYARTENIYSRAECPLINVYDMEEPLQFYNTLLLYNILSLFDFITAWKVEDVIENITKMGADELLVENGIRKLLQTNLLCSREGYRLHEDKIRVIRRTDPGKILLKNCIMTLSYLETMAFRTFLEKSFHRLLPEYPKNVSDQILGAAVLYRQILADETREDAYLESNSNSSLKQQLRMTTSLSTKISSSVLDSLNQIHYIQENPQLKRKYENYFSPNLPFEI
ncbi:MAG: hypothetical protein KAI03_05715 [Candidatus Aureabacteria bacterium]|nr:hypothetical protein [Candidatus Auribacterota bacterium]